MLLKRLIFLYFILLIFEGALRKWILPGLATPLLVVRDPVVIAIYIVAFSRRAFPLNTWILALSLLAVVSSIATLAMGHGDVAVLAYGLRANFLHIPLIFVVWAALDRQDVLRYCRWVLYLTIPMTVLLVIQFLSPPTAWVNIGIGGEGTSSFAGAGGRMRSSGTFSFITGINSFYTIAAACWMAVFIERVKLPRVLLILTGVCIILAIPMSISRGLLFACAIVLVGGTVVLFRMPGWGQTLPRLILLAGISVLIVSQLPVFNEATEAFGERWEQSTVRGGGFQSSVINRIATDLIGPFRYNERNGLMGFGLGAGTMGGARLMTGERGFLGGEGEWFRLQFEMGLLMGSLFIFYRSFLVLRFAQYGWYHLRHSNMIPWLLFLGSAPLILTGQWGQATQLGFAVLWGGMALAAGRRANPQE